MIDRFYLLLFWQYSHYSVELFLQVYHLLAMCAITNFLRKLYYKIAISFMRLYNKQKSQTMEIDYYEKYTKSNLDFTK